MTEAHLLAGEELERTIHRVAAMYTDITGRAVCEVRPPWLFEILLQAYPGLEPDAVVARLESLAAEHGQEILRVIKDHSEGATDYVESRDRLYGGPEVLLIADLARHRPARLRAAAGPSDFASVVEAMAGEFSA